MAVIFAIQYNLKDVIPFGKIFTTDKLPKHPISKICTIQNLKSKIQNVITCKSAILWCVSDAVLVPVGD